MRELQLSSANFSKTFEDIENLAAMCRFHDCRHTSEPGCAVTEAISAGILAAERYENYRKLISESDYDGMSSRQVDNAKIRRLFGSRAEMKQIMNETKMKNRR